MHSGVDQTRRLGDTAWERESGDGIPSPRMWSILAGRKFASMSDRKCCSKAAYTRCIRLYNMRTQLSSKSCHWHAICSRWLSLFCSKYGRHSTVAAAIPPALQFTWHACRDSRLVSYLHIHCSAYRESTATVLRVRLLKPRPRNLLPYAHAGSKPLLAAGNPLLWPLFMHHFNRDVSYLFKTGWQCLLMTPATTAELKSESKTHFK